jgi:hypothetical protein
MTKIWIQQNQSKLHKKAGGHNTTGKQLTIPKTSMPRIRSTGFSICPHPLMDQMAEPGGKQRVCIYLLLHRYGNGSEQGCYASVTTMAKQLGMKRADVMAAITWLITNGWATYTTAADGRRRHIYLNADQRKSGTQKGTSAQKGTIAIGTQKGTDIGAQKGTLTKSHKQDPSTPSVRAIALTTDVDQVFDSKTVKTKAKALAPALARHADLIHAFWKIKKGSKGDIAWKLLCTELTKFHDSLGPAAVEEQLTQAINGKWAGISYSRHLQFNPHLVTAPTTTTPQYDIR